MDQFEEWVDPEELEWRERQDRRRRVSAAMLLFIFAVIPAITWLAFEIVF